jgi:hypothetical protein
MLILRRFWDGSVLLSFLGKKGDVEIHDVYTLHCFSSCRFSSLHSVVILIVHISVLPSSFASVCILHVHRNHQNCGNKNCGNGDHSHKVLLVI